MSDKSKACKGIDVDERGLQNVEANNCARGLGNSLLGSGTCVQPAGLVCDVGQCERDNGAGSVLGGTPAGVHGFSREGHCQGQASVSDCGLLHVQNHSGRESGIKRKIGEGYHHTLDHVMVEKKSKTDLAGQSYLSKKAVSDVGEGCGTSKAKVDTDVSLGGHAISFAQRTAERRHGDARFPINLDFESGTASYMTPADGVLGTGSCVGLSVGSMTVGRSSRKRRGNFVGPLTEFFKKQKLTLDEAALLGCVLSCGGGCA